MIRAQILSPYVGDGTQASPYRALLGDEYTLESLSDVTGRDATTLIPAPNLLVVEVLSDEQTIAKIAGDTKYRVLWQETETEPGAEEGTI